MIKMNKPTFWIAIFLHFKVDIYIYFKFACSSNIIKLLFPFKYPIKDDTLILGGIFNNIWIWSDMACASIISTPLYSHSLLRYLPMSVLNLAYIALRRYLGVNTIWYWQFHLVCDKLLVSSFLRGIKPSFLDLGNWSFPL